MSAQRLLCVNAGSSSLRVTMFELASPGELRVVANATVERIGDEPMLADGASEEATEAPDHAAALDRVLELDSMGGVPVAIGHRLVHGGPNHAGPALLDDATIAGLDQWRALAPLHLPIALGLVRATGARFPGVPQVGCFDTAFGHSLPAEARRLPIPARLDAAGLKRYGFHGLSHQSVIHVVGARALGRAVLAHLGAGASLAAVLDGRPVHTTMALTPSAGTIMATRPGDLDPGLLVYLVEQGMDAGALRHLIDHECGLTGISGTTGDMRELLARRQDDADAALAIDLFCRSVAMHAAACTAVLGGLDTLVFTGGIGEHSSELRADIVRRLEHLDVWLDHDLNERGEPVISSSESDVTVYAMRSDEESVIARETVQVVLG